MFVSPLWSRHHSLLNQLIGAIEQRRFPDAIAIIGALREFTTLTKAIERHERDQTQLLAESGKLAAAQDEVERLKEQNAKLQISAESTVRTLSGRLALVTEQLNQSRGENASLLKTLGENDEKNRRVKSRLGSWGTL